MKNNYLSKSRILFLLLDIIIVAFAFLSVKLLCYGGFSWITYSNYVDIAIIATVFVLIGTYQFNKQWDLYLKTGFLPDEQIPIGPFLRPSALF